MKTPSPIWVASVLLSFCAALLHAGDAQIFSVHQAGDEILVEAQAPAGFKKLTLEGRGEDGSWQPRSVRRTDGAAGSVTFNVPIADHFELLRVRAEREERLAAKFFTGTSSFHEYSAPPPVPVSQPASLTLVNNSGGGRIIFRSFPDEFQFQMGPYGIDDIFPKDEFLVEVSHSGGTNSSGVVRVALASDPHVEIAKLELQNGAIQGSTVKGSKLYLLQSQYESGILIDSTQDQTLTLSIVDLATLPNLTIAGEVQTNLSLSTIATEIRAVWPSENTLVFGSALRTGVRTIRPRSFDPYNPGIVVHKRSLFNLYQIQEPIMLVPTFQTVFINPLPLVTYPIFYPVITIISPFNRVPELLAFNVADPAQPTFESKVALDEMVSSGASELHAANDLVYLSHTVTEMEVTGSNAVVAAVVKYQTTTNIGPVTNITTVPQRIVSTNEVIRTEIEATITGVDLVTNVIEKLSVSRFVRSLPDSLGAPITEVAAGSRHAVSLDGDGKIDAWGNNTFDQLGSGLLPTLPGIASIATGDSHTLARDTDGQVWGWGANYSAQVIPAVSSFPVPFPVISQSVPVTIPGLPDTVAVAAGDFHSLALDENGEVWSWGANIRGQLGVGDELPRPGPVLVSGLSKIVAIAAGSAHNLALDDEGRAYVWGDNSEGQLALDEPIVSSPALLNSSVAITAIAAGNSHTLLLTADGEVFASGNNDRGALGNGSVESSNEFEQVAGLPAIAQIVAGRDRSFAIDLDGGVWVWGRNDFGQADAAAAEDILSPRKLEVLPPVSAVSAGGAFTIALAETGELWSWGRNLDGELGSGSEYRHTNFFQITDVQSVTNLVYQTNSFVDLVVRTNLVYARQTNVVWQTNILTQPYLTHQTNWINTYRQVTKSFANVIDFSNAHAPVVRSPVSIPGRLAGLSHDGAILYTTAAHSSTNGEFQGQWIEAVSYDGAAAYHVASQRLQDGGTPMVEVAQGRVFVLDEGGAKLLAFELSDAPSLDLVDSIAVPQSSEMQMIGSRIVLKNSNSSSVELYDPETLSRQGSVAIPAGVYFPLENLAPGPAGFWIARGWSEPIQLVLEQE